MSSPGFIAIYRWRVPAEHEAAFRDRWRAVTLSGQALGGFGSLLGRSSGDLLVAIALWPSEEARAQAFAAMNDESAWPPGERLSEKRLAILDDCWTASPF